MVGFELVHFDQIVCKGEHLVFKNKWIRRVTTSQSMFRKHMRCKTVSWTRVKGALLYNPGVTMISHYKQS